MIFRLTQKLATKLHEELAASLPLSNNPFLDWSATLFRAERAQYILLMNTQSLYAVVMHGAGITDHGTFLDQVIPNMRDTMAEDGLFLFHARIAPHTNAVAFSKTSGRSATGSLNELVFHATCHLVEDQLSPRDTSLRLNEIPMKSIGYQYPREAFQKLKTQSIQPSLSL